MREIFKIFNLLENDVQSIAAVSVRFSPENNSQEQQAGNAVSATNGVTGVGRWHHLNVWVLIRFESRNTRVCDKYCPDRSLRWRCVPSCCSWMKLVNNGEMFLAVYILAKV